MAKFALRQRPGPPEGREPGPPGETQTCSVGLCDASHVPEVVCAGRDKIPPMSIAFPVCVRSAIGFISFSLSKSQNIATAEQKARCACRPDPFCAFMVVHATGSRVYLHLIFHLCWNVYLCWFVVFHPVVSGSVSSADPNAMPGAQPGVHSMVQIDDPLKVLLLCCAFICSGLPVAIGAAC